ncbi:MAG: nucleotide exchange factor GrpE [Lentisphaerae bacterium]|nr:nucleotide exchange factor GrpE [Lentisphaerota bacterium]
MSGKNKKEGKANPVSPESLPGSDAEMEQVVPNQNQEAADSKASETQSESLPDPSPEELLALANDRYLRARADFENYRKRMAREFTEVRENTRQQTVSEFLGIYDFILLAIEHAETAVDMDAIRQGLRMIFTEFERTFENLDVKLIETVGKDFDPNLHEAISQEASADIPEGKIIRQWKPGFTLGNRLLRPASVVVSSGQPVPEPAQDETAPE